MHDAIFAALRVAVITLLLSGWVTVGDVWAQSHTDDTLSVEVNTMGYWYGNFFQAPDGSPKRDVFAFEVEPRLEVAMDEALEGLIGYGELTAVWYDAFDPSVGFTLGASLDREVHESEAYVQYQRDRPTLEVGDTLGLADTLRLGGEYSYRVAEDWELSAFGDFTQESYGPTPDRDSDILSAGGAVRYRGFGYEFHPEVGVELRERDVVDPNDDYEQSELFLQIRSLPHLLGLSIPRTYLSLRIRHRDRDYTVGSPAGSNFGRKDDRVQWRLYAEMDGAASLTYQLYFAHEDANSTKPSRNFTTQVLGVGVRLEL